MPRRNRPTQLTWTPRTGKVIRPGGSVFYRITSGRFGTASPAFVTQHRALAIRVSGRRAEVTV